MPSLDHFEEGSDGSHPCDDMGPSRPRIGDCDNRPGELQKVVERGEEVSPRTLVPNDGIGSDRSQATSGKPPTMGCCVFESTRCMQRRPFNIWHHQFFQAWCGKDC